MWRNTLTLVTLVYLVQGVGISYISNIYKPALEYIVLDNMLQGMAISLVLIPFLLKIPLAYLSDKLARNGLRSQIITFGSILGAVVSACLLFLTIPAAPVLVSLLLFIVILCIAVCDVAADGIAVDRAKSRIGLDNTIRMQAMMFMARALGIALGAIVFTVLSRNGYDSLGFLLFICVFLTVAWHSRSISLLSLRQNVAPEAFTCFTGLSALLKVSMAGVLAFVVWGSVETLSTNISTTDAMIFGDKDFSSAIGASIRTIGILVASLWVYRFTFSFRDMTAAITSLVLSVSCLLFLTTESVVIYLSCQFIYGFALTIVFVWLTSTIVSNANPKYGALSFTMVATLCNVGFILSPTILGIIETLYTSGVVSLSVSATSFLLGVYIFFFYARPGLINLEKRASRV